MNNNNNNITYLYCTDLGRILCGNIIALHCMFDFGVMGFFKLTFVWYCEQNTLFEGLDMFPFPGHTGGVVSPHFGCLETASLNQ
jgi:hypothetical protein